MFGHRYYGRRFFGPRYFGPRVGAPAAPPPAAPPLMMGRGISLPIRRGLRRRLRGRGEWVAPGPQLYGIALVEPRTVVALPQAPPRYAIGRARVVAASPIAMGRSIRHDGALALLLIDDLL